MVVPAVTAHNLTNTGKKPMRRYTLCGPPNHRYHLDIRTRAEAETLVEHFEGTTPE